MVSKNPVNRMTINLVVTKRSLAQIPVDVFVINMWSDMKAANEHNISLDSEKLLHY